MKTSNYIKHAKSLSPLIPFTLGHADYIPTALKALSALKTAELAGHTVKKRGKRHYKLAEIMLTGEAITLAMRTSLNFDKIPSNP